MKKLAIVSVWDKTNLEPFARGLVEAGIGILSTGGTAKYLTSCGIELQSIDSYTGHPEILDGRVKTLHPKIHGGILARRDRQEDLVQLQENGIAPIEFVVVNLYPFVDKVREIEAKRKADHGSLVEFIDIGGPTMIRAAAKNSKHVVPVCDPRDYDAVLSELRHNGEISAETRARLAGKVFTTMAAYDGAIARYFSLGEQLLNEDGSPKRLAPVESIVLEQSMSLRYGENPHQSAGLYRPAEVGAAAHDAWWHVTQGKELSYNNLLDMQGTLDLFLELMSPQESYHTAVIIKHSNPCGAAIRATARDAFVAARECDPVSAFGGIVAVSGMVDAELASTIVEGFVEVVLVRDLTPEAAEVFAKKKNVRLIICDFERYLAEKSKGALSVRNFFGDYLVQSIDNQLTEPTAERVVSKAQPTAEMMSDMQFAWKVCKHVKSNAIVLVKDQRAIGIGAGQMSRVDAAKIAIQRAKTHGFAVEGTVAASDAFLPFTDTLETLNDAGVAALVQPGGSIKDQEVFACADARGVVMALTGERHFRH